MAAITESLIGISARWVRSQNSEKQHRNVKGGAVIVRHNAFLGLSARTSSSRLSHSQDLPHPGSYTKRATGRMGVRMAAAEGQVAHTTSFEGISTEAELLAGIQKEVEANKISQRAGMGMEYFYRSYLKAVVGSGVEKPEELTVRVMASVFDRIMVQFEEPFTFPSHHLRMTAPYDYYKFGQNYVQPLIQYSNSYLGNRQLFDKIQTQLDEGHNVVLLANHQTEADPAVMALMLEASHPRLATDLTYVAGDRVVLDPFCKPFSMGRNLLCVYSKKRINDDPASTADKMAANRRTLKEMSKLMKKGGLLIWIAPSGGRDRPDPTTGEYAPAEFDVATVEMMRRLCADSPQPGHLYPTALLCYDIMPPPPTIEKALGELRVIGHHGVGVAVAPELDFDAICGHLEDRKEAREVFSQAAYDSVAEIYSMLHRAIHKGEGVAAALPGVGLSQPWAEQAHSGSGNAAPLREPAAPAAVASAR